MSREIKCLILGGAALAASLPIAFGQACAAGSAQEINGNWYCQAVSAISYFNFGTPGTYQRVTAMGDGECATAPQSYSGGIAPLDEDVSWHFRGPLWLKQFAFYTPGSGTPEAGLQPVRHKKRHHQHFHSRNKEIIQVQDHYIREKREAEGVVTATIFGQVVSWTVDDNGPTGSAPAPPNGDVVITATVDGEVVSWISTIDAPSLPAPTNISPETVTSAQVDDLPSGTPSVIADAGNWEREAYYDADFQTAQGLVFLNHNGGQGSGVFDDFFGNSLSYASPDGEAGSSTPTILANQMLDDNVEVVVMSNQPCSGDCGTVRPGTVAYHGFEGGLKLFLFEFSMPSTGKTGNTMDMPAIWALNAQIPRTVQYGDCSCWASGCGELDVFEILDSGNTRAKSTYHGNPAGGDSNYFTRPTNQTIKLAVIFDGPASAANILVIPDDASFDPIIPNSTIAGWFNSISSPGQTAIFNLVS